MTAAGWPLALAGIGQYFVAPRVLAEFAAPDPWRGGNATGWMLVLFLVSESKVGIDAAADYARRHYWKDDLPGPGRRDFAFAETVALERSDPSAEPILLPMH